MSLNIFGALIIQNHGGEKGVTHKHLAMVSDVIDTDAKCAAMFLEHAKAWIEDIGGVKHISMWSDCGPHFRAYEHMGYCFKSWYVPFACSLRIALFAEKHGKGLVDALFAMVRGWIRAKLSKLKTLIKDIPSLVSALRDGAESTMRLDKPPQGPEYIIEHVTSDRKPASVWRVESKYFHLEQSYCWEIRQGRDPSRENAIWYNTRYADITLGEQLRIRHVLVQTSKVADRNWRKGYYGSKRWDQPPPTKKKRGPAGTIINRMEAQEAYAPDDADEEPEPNLFEKKLAAFGRAAALRRAKQQRMTAAQRARVEAALKEACSDFASDSSSSSTSSSSSCH